MSARPEEAAVVELELPDFDTLPRERLQEMTAAGDEIRECYRVLGKAGLNVVGEILKGQGNFYEMDHYPKGDVYDPETHSQYYYHAHRAETGEHGHFHTFLRRKGMTEGMTPVAYDGDAEWPQGDDVLSHLVCISMNKQGFPIGLFAVNRWVTGENWFRAQDVIVMLDRFLVDHAYPSWPVNRWISAMIRLFRPQVVALLEHRDQVVSAWRRANPGVDVFEDRNLEVTGSIEIGVDEQLEEVRKALARDP